MSGLLRNQGVPESEDAITMNLLELYDMIMTAYAADVKSFCKTGQKRQAIQYCEGGTKFQHLRTLSDAEDHVIDTLP